MIARVNSFYFSLLLVKLMLVVLPQLFNLVLEASFLSLYYARSLREIWQNFSRMRPRGSLGRSWNLELSSSMVQEKVFFMRWRVMRASRQTRPLSNCFFSVLDSLEIKLTIYFSYSLVAIETAKGHISSLSLSVSQPAPSSPLAFFSAQ